MLVRTIYYLESQAFPEYVLQTKTLVLKVIH